VIEYSKGGYAPVMRDRSTFRTGPRPGRGKASIAVLPFVEPESPIPITSNFSDGLLKLISALTNVKGLRVVRAHRVFFSIQREILRCA